MDMYDILLARYLGAGGGGGGGGDSKDANADVVLFDYDGTVVKSYTKEEFLALSALPANPSHEGLTGQGWNYSLTDAKAYVTKYGKIRIGQTYITSDGKTRIKIKLEDGRLEPVLGLGINGTVDVDWGDNTTHGTMTGDKVATLVQLKHVYAAPGEYTIALTVEGSMAFLGNSVYLSALLRKDGVTSATSAESRPYQNAVKEVYIGSGVTTFTDYSFCNCHSLTSITIPDGVTSIGANAFGACFSIQSVIIPDGVTSIVGNAFQQCSSLKSVIFPDSVTSISGSTFYNCSAFSSVIIPDSVTSISNYMFYYCYSITSVIIPDSVTSIGSYAFTLCASLTSISIPADVASIGANAFQNCHSLAFIKFKGSTPPTAEGSNTFVNLPTDCIIYVPAGSLEDYEDATNYPDPDVYQYIEY